MAKLTIHTFSGTVYDLTVDDEAELPPLPKVPEWVTFEGDEGSFTLHSGNIAAISVYRRIV